jgi:hypothetical protein
MRYREQRKQRLNGPPSITIEKAQAVRSAHTNKSLPKLNGPLSITIGKARQLVSGSRPTQKSPKTLQENVNRQAMIQRPTTTPTRQGDTLPLRPTARVRASSPRPAPIKPPRPASCPLPHPSAQGGRPSLTLPSTPARTPADPSTQ